MARLHLDGINFDRDDAGSNDGENFDRDGVALNEVAKDKGDPEEGKEAEEYEEGGGSDWLEKGYSKALKSRVDASQHPRDPRRSLKAFRGIFRDFDTDITARIDKLSSKKCPDNCP